MKYFYDGQIRRYLIQVIRLLSNFVVRYSDGRLVQVPVVYADPDRQASSVLNQNSENTIQSAPKIAVYITDLSLDTTRLSDSSFVGKVNIRERAIDQDTGDYANYEGNSYTVERLMPTPYRLSIKVDIWTVNTEQKLQLLEQILTLFNPSLEIQTTDNYVDWTSLTVVDLEQISFSSRTIPVGSSTEIDIATLSLATPIYLSPPAKVKRLGVITSIISNIFSGVSDPYGDYIDGLGTDPSANDRGLINPLFTEIFTIGDYDVLVTNSGATLIGEGGATSWYKLIRQFRPGEYVESLSRIYIKQPNGTFVVGSFAINPLDDSTLSVNWDPDSFPSNEQIPSNNRAPESLGTFDAIIDPQKFNPLATFGSYENIPIGHRFLILDDIGGVVKKSFVSSSALTWINTNVPHNIVYDHKIYVNGVEVGSSNRRVPDNLKDGIYFIIVDSFIPSGSEVYYELYTNEEGPVAWKNEDGGDFVAEAGDIIEWSGTNWVSVFKSSENADSIIYMTNLFTGTQYKWDGVSWSKSFEGTYKKGYWNLEL